MPHHPHRARSTRALLATGALIGACDHRVDLGLVTLDTGVDTAVKDAVVPEVAPMDASPPDVAPPDVAPPDVAPIDVASDASEVATARCESSPVAPGRADCRAACPVGAVDGCCRAWEAGWVGGISHFRVAPSRAAPLNEQHLAAYAPSLAALNLLHFFRSPDAGVAFGFDTRAAPIRSLMTTFAGSAGQAVALYDRSTGSALVYNTGTPPLGSSTPFPTPSEHSWGAGFVGVVPLSVDGQVYLLGHRPGRTDITLLRVDAPDRGTTVVATLHTSRPFDAAELLDAGSATWLLLRDEALGQTWFERVALSATTPRAPTALRADGPCIVDGMPGVTRLVATWTAPPDEASGREFVLYDPDTGVADVRRLDPTGARVERSRALQLVIGATHLFLYRMDGLSRLVAYGPTAPRATSYRYAPW